MTDETQNGSGDESPERKILRELVDAYNAIALDLGPEVWGRLDGAIAQAERLLKSEP